MPQIGREEGNRTHAERRSQLRGGPGIFVYDGEEYDNSSEPTVLLADGVSQEMFDDHGRPVVDSSGRQVYQRRGTVVRDADGNPVMGGIPKITREKIAVRVIQGVKFPAGSHVKVKNAALAVKLRGMDHFVEVDPEEAKKPGKQGNG